MVRFREQAGPTPRLVKLSAAFERLRYPGISPGQLRVDLITPRARRGVRWNGEASFSFFAE
jgi:hypothetical protein